MALLLGGFNRHVVRFDICRSGGTGVRFGQRWGRSPDANAFGRGQLVTWALATIVSAAGEAWHGVDLVDVHHMTTTRLERSHHEMVA